MKYAAPAWKMDGLLQRLLKQNSGMGVNVFLNVTGQAPLLSVSARVYFATPPVTASFVLTTESGGRFSGSLTGDGGGEYGLTASIGSTLGGTLEITADGEVFTGRFEVDPYLADGGILDGNNATGLATPPPPGAARLIWTSLTDTAALPEAGALQAGPAVSIAYNEVMDGRLNGAAISLRYNDQDVAGIDETSLVLYQWSFADAAWQPAGGQWVSAASNIASAPMEEEGLFALFGAPTNDTTPPAGINDLAAVTGTENWTVELTWTAPGDDGGEAVTAYDIRFSEEALDAANVTSAAQYRVNSEPATPGGTETLTVSLPQPGTLYHFAVLAVDEAGNVSALSNAVSARSFAQDSDGDGMPDAYEISRGLDPMYADAHLDTDGDGLDHGEEYLNSTDPLSADTDTDGMPDGWENSHGLNPLQAGDADGADGDPDEDGFSNLEEYEADTDPMDAASVPSGKITGCAAGSADTAGTFNGDGIALVFSMLLLIAFAHAKPRRQAITLKK